jgi:drug/metabolite transporter (DMT)-like permease
MNNYQSTLNQNNIYLTGLRGIGLSFFAYIVGKAQNVEYEKSPIMMKMLIIRNMLMAIEQTILFYCISRLPQSLAYVIYNTAPMWVYIINFFIYGQKFILGEVISILFSFVGLFMATVPNYVHSIIFGN